MTQNRYYTALMNKRVLLQSLNQTGDGAGGFTSSWQTTATVWAHIAPISAGAGQAGGGEYFYGMQTESNQFFRITIRFMANVTPMMRVVMGSRIFNIRRVVNKEEQNAVLELIAEEGVAI